MTTAGMWWAEEVAGERMHAHFRALLVVRTSEEVDGPQRVLTACRGAAPI